MLHKFHPSFSITSTNFWAGTVFLLRIGSTYLIILVWHFMWNRRTPADPGVSAQIIAAKKKGSNTMALMTGEQYIESIRKLNRQFRNIDRSTDVLSFPLFDYEGAEDEPPVDEFMGMLGDIVISLETAKRQAAEYGHSFERETAFLCVHSMLHLLGYDHERSEEEDTEMRAKQTEIMKIMGLEVK